MSETTTRWLGLFFGGSLLTAAILDAIGLAHNPLLLVSSLLIGATLATALVARG